MRSNLSCHPWRRGKRSIGNGCCNRCNRNTYQKVQSNCGCCKSTCTTTSQPYIPPCQNDYNIPEVIYNSQTTENINSSPPSLPPSYVTNDYYSNDKKIQEIVNYNPSFIESSNLLKLNFTK
uniref:Uncharacterized protein n=1 Tax=Parastrongyloides trichosuri TaxID=131310 RepID=A0A0N4ZR49_PARTI